MVDLLPHRYNVFNPLFLWSKRRCVEAISWILCATVWAGIAQCYTKTQNLFRNVETGLHMVWLLFLVALRLPFWFWRLPLWKAIMYKSGWDFSVQVEIFFFVSRFSYKYNRVFHIYIFIMCLCSSNCNNYPWYASASKYINFLSCYVALWSML